MQTILSHSDDRLPISDALFARLVRSAPEDVCGLVGSLSETKRASLALFCNSRAHLRPLGHAIADTCSPEALMHLGGQVGVFLSDRAKRDTSKPPHIVRLPTSVTLSSGSPRAEV